MVFYERIKGNTPTQIKVSPTSAIPHNSKQSRSILDLSFSFKLTPHGRVPSVNKKIKKTAPGGAIDQIWHDLLRLIHAFSEAPECENMFQEKLEIKGGFWKLILKRGKN